MMALKQWVDDLQSQLVLDSATGFIASLHLFLKLPATVESEEEKAEMLIKSGIETKKRM